jgi:dihydrofolate reductase
MGKLISFMHISLDGFVAGPNGEMDWIKVDDEIFDHAGARISQSGTAVYGRVTYQMMESYWPTAADGPGASKHDIEHSAWYKKAFKVVLSRTMERLDSPHAKIIGDGISEQMNKLKLETDGEILVFGSPTATHSLAGLDLIDGYWLFVNPVILGKGIPLFSAVKEKTNLKLTGSRVFSSGVVALDYTVSRQ